MARNTGGWREILEDEHKKSCRFRIGSLKY
jgi:hypothetical protein